MEHTSQLLTEAADNIRVLVAAMVEKAKSGHPGGAMGGADFINVLYSEFLKFDPDCPSWECRAPLCLRLALKERVEFFEIQYDDGENCSELDHDKEHIHERRRYIKTDELIDELIASTDAWPLPVDKAALAAGGCNGDFFGRRRGARCFARPAGA